MAVMRPEEFSAEVPGRETIEELFAALESPLLGYARRYTAFNEDARVQLNNLKLQQALIGLDARQSATGRENESRPSRDLNYTQQDAQRIIDSHSADENAALMKLAQRLIQQQDAAVANPAVIRANIPEQGRSLTFKRAVVVDTWADLNINLAARSTDAMSWVARGVILLVVAIGLAALAGICRRESRL